MELAKLLNSKPLYYSKFDPKRVVAAYQLIQNHIKHPKRVQIIGTNGKGSTGRAVAHLAFKSGLCVSHYTSPHIIDYKERFWRDGKFATEDELEAAHQKLFLLLQEKMALSLSYFEYLTLLSFVLFENCDLQVVEAGLGGEYDATSVASYDLTIVTPIGLDHGDFLGQSIEEVATTKLNAMSQKALIAKQAESGVYKIANSIAKKKGSRLYLFEELEPSTIESIKVIAQNRSWPKYLVENITTACFGLDILGIKYSTGDLKSLEIFGRFYHFRENIILDVGHNPLAARVIVKALQEDVVLLFNMLADKAIKEVIEILQPKIKRVEIIDINTQRVAPKEQLESILQSLNIKHSNFNGTLEPKENYLVFGSFYTVESFLKSVGVESIEAK